MNQSELSLGDLKAAHDYAQIKFDETYKDWSINIDKYNADKLSDLCDKMAYWEKLKTHYADEIERIMVPFDIYKALRGHPVRTRGGGRARVLCVDRTGGLPVIALVNENGFEKIEWYWQNGRKFEKEESNDDLLLT